MRSFYDNLKRDNLTMRRHKPAWAREGFIYCLNSFGYKGYCYEIASSGYAPPCIVELVSYLVDNCCWERLKQFKCCLSYTKLSRRQYL